MALEANGGRKIPRAEVTGDCKLSSLGAGNWTRVLWKSSKAWSISPDPRLEFLSQIIVTG